MGRIRAKALEARLACLKARVAAIPDPEEEEDEIKQKRRTTSTMLTSDLPTGNPSYDR